MSLSDPRASLDTKVAKRKIPALPGSESDPSSLNDRYLLLSLRIFFLISVNGSQKYKLMYFNKNTSIYIPEIHLQKLKKKKKPLGTGEDRLCGLVIRVSGYRSRGPGFDARPYQIF
jgi:hypothetical protein